MSGGRSFRSVFMVASCAGAALGCYLVSLRVASERAALEDVEQKIVLAQRDIRVLQTEIGTRGRLAQLEKWNAKVLALSAPSADQFLEGGFALARLAQPEDKIDLEAPVVLASAPAPESEQAPLEQGSEQSDSGSTPSASKLMHHASLKVPQRQVATVTAAPEMKAPNNAPPVAKKPAAAAPRKPAVAAEKPASPAKKSGALAAAPAPKKTVDNKRLAAAKPVTKPVRIAKSDPLAPLPDSGTSKTAKDSGSAR